jgi:hypothetical protein
MKTKRLIKEDYNFKNRVRNLILEGGNNLLVLIGLFPSMLYILLTKSIQPSIKLIIFIIYQGYLLIILCIKIKQLLGCYKSLGLFE